MNITINEPCHENWDAMTPNQQGAFCKSCMKNVVDFSKMKLEEIKTFFSEPQTGKVCGRFEEKQLTTLSFDDFFARFRYWNFAKKFAVIFFFTFGFWLFSSQALGQNSHHLKGEVAFIPDKKPKKDSVRKQNPQDDRRIMGKIKCTRPKPQQVEELMIMGDVAIPETLTDTSRKNTSPVKQPELVKDTAIASELMIVGLIAIVPENNRTGAPNEVQAKNPNTETDSLGQIVKKDPINTQPQAGETVTIYPNPANSYFMVQTNVTGKHMACLYDESGKLMLTKEIEGTAQIDAAGLDKGSYYLIVAGNATEAVTRKKVIIVK